MPRRIYVPLTLTLIFLAGCASSPRPVNKMVTVSEPQAPFPVPIMQMHGSGAEMGEQYAKQVGPELKDLFRRYFGSYFQSNVERTIALTVAGAFETHVTPEHRAEIAALAAGTGLEEREIMLAQCFLDATPMVACSTITLPAQASSDHVARFGRNLDFPGFNIAEQSTILAVYHPKDRFAFAAVSWPGIIGVISGMNEHGLTLASMEVDRPQRLPVAMPYMLLYRTILEQCKTVDEAIAYLNKTPRQTANNLMLMDASGNRAVAEITPEKLTVRQAPVTAALVSTNHHRGTDLNTSGRCDRFDYLHDTSAKNFGHDDVAEIKSMLAHVAQGNMTLQSMVFEPSTRVIYLAVGANAPTHPYSRLDLKPLFRE